MIKIGAVALDDRGMLVDFKTVIARRIDVRLDHRTLLNREDPVVEYFQAQNESHYLLYENPTAENIAKLIYQVAEDQGFPIIGVYLWETPHCFATYTG